MAAGLVLAAGLVVAPPGRAEAVGAAVSCPAPTALTLGFKAGGSLSAGDDPSVPVRGSWTGGDASCTYVTQRLIQSTWSVIGNGPSPWVDVALYPGPLPALRVRSANPDGGLSSPVRFPARNLDQLQDTQFTYSGRVSTTSSPTYWGGTATTLNGAGTTAQVNIVGDSFAVVGSRGSGYGAARVVVDGKTLGTISAYYPSTSHRQVLASYQLARGGSHAVKLVNIVTGDSPIFSFDGIAVLAA